MAGRHPVGAEAAGALEQEVELDPGVAAHAGARGAAGEVVLHEGVHDLLAELLVHAQGVVGDARLLGHPPGVPEVERAAATAVGLDARLVPEEHGEAHHGHAPACQQPGGDGGVQAAAHGDGGHPGGTAHATALVEIGETRRSSATSRSSASRKASTSSTVLVMPKLTRSDESASSTRQPDGEQGLARLDGPRGAGRAGGDGEAREVEPDQQRLAFDAREGHVRGVGQPRRGLAVEERRPASAWPIQPRSGRVGPRDGRPRSAISSPAAAAASPSPTSAGTFSVPARRRRSWPPPTR